MCDELDSFRDRCEPLIRDGRFSELVQALQTCEPHMARCVACRRQGTFYRAVWLGMAQRDYVSSRLRLDALVESDQADEVLAARALNFAAMMAEFQDRYGDSLRLYQRAFDTCTATSDLNGQARALFNQAIVYNTYLRDPNQALRLLEQAEKALKQAGNESEMVRVLNERGLCLMNLKRWTEAREALEASHTLCVEQDNPYFKAICETNLGSWERLQGHWDAAEAWYAPLPASFEREGNPLLQAEVLFYLSEVAQAQGRLDQAHTYLDKVLQLAKGNESHHFMALACLGLARLAGYQENSEQALNLYWQAVREIEQVRSAQGVRNVRLSFQAEWNALYREATACALQLNRTQDGLLLSEHARARVLLDTLGVPPGVTRPDAPPDLLNEIDQLGQALHRSYAQYIADRLDHAGQALLQTQESRLAEIRAILDRYDQESLPYQSLPELSQIQQTLAENTVILSYFGTRAGLVVFAIDRNRIRQRQLQVSLENIQSRLNTRGQIRDLMPDRHTGRLALQLGILHQLYGGLLAPIADWLSDYTTIYLSPDTELRHIPFHLLTPAPDQPCPLTDGDRRLMYLPSASVLPRLPGSQIAQLPLIIGYNGPGLMLVEAHARQVARSTSGRLLCGSDVMREPVMQAMNQYTQIYFVGHNVFRTGAPADCGLLLAEDRLLTLLDVQRLRLHGSRVILGACQSSLVAELGGDWLGLTSAFLQAGAAQVMGTLWPVNELVICLLMDRFWAALPRHGGDSLAALRRAQAEIRSFTLGDIHKALEMYDLPPQARDYVQDQLAALNHVLPGTTHPLDHPYYWGPFVLTGS